MLATSISTKIKLVEIWRDFSKVFKRILRLSTVVCLRSMVSTNFRRALLIHPFDNLWVFPNFLAYEKKRSRLSAASSLIRILQNWPTTMRSLWLSFAFQTTMIQCLLVCPKLAHQTHSGVALKFRLSRCRLWLAMQNINKTISSTCKSWSSQLWHSTRTILNCVTPTSQRSKAWAPSCT